jgi:hypothetical protein
VYTNRSRIINSLDGMASTPPLTLENAASEDFFSLVGLQDIDDEQKSEILESMTTTVYSRVYGYIYYQLTPEERKEMDILSTERMIDYLVSKGFDVPEMLVTEAANYRIELAKMFELATTPNSELADQAGVSANPEQ